MFEKCEYFTGTWSVVNENNSSNKHTVKIDTNNMEIKLIEKAKKPTKYDDLDCI